jgi:two-component system chemotaxis response regulator CheB
VGNARAQYHRGRRPAGGVEALINLVRGLPADLPASVFVVLHTPPHSASHLPAILARHGPLSAVHAEDGQAIEPGCNYVEPPARHLIVRNGHVEFESRSAGEPHAAGDRPVVLLGSALP